ncbi:hypothetical protein RB195_021334 [Necator americanus]|uniref:Uncharacterized protein n=1 Tax=Necator americanus TaxID=51031 RepID=A0ABR1EAV0_NECAM
MYFNFWCFEFIRDHPNETDEFWDQTPPERTKVNVGDFCSSATAAAKIADIYKDRADPIVREHRRGLVYLQALDEMEIARILYVRALSMLSPINSRLATRLVIRVLPTLVYTSAVIFRSMINDLDPDSHAHSVLLAMTMQYLNLLKRFETSDPHPYFADGSYGGCLLIVASGYTMFSQVLLKHSDESVKAKGIDCLEMALDAHNVILRNNATSTQKSHSFDELATVYEKLIRAKIEHFASLVSKETTTAEELRTLSKNCAYLILNFHDHMIQVLLNREAPVEEENVNFEVCGLQQWLIRAEHVSDNAKIFGCRQLLIWLRMMVGNTVLTVSDPDKAVERLRALRFEIEKLMLGMTLRFPQHAYLRTGFELMHKIRADEVSTLSHEISTSILEILESIPPIEVIDEIPDYVPVNIVEE